MHAGAEAGLGPRPSRVWWKDRGRTRERAQAGLVLLPRVEKLLVVPAGRSSRPPVLSVSDQYNLPPKPVGAGCVPNTLVPAVTLKKNPFDLSFSDFSENPAPGTLSPVSFMRLPKTCSSPTPNPQLLIDLEVGTFRSGGMISHQQPGHGLGSAAEAAIFVLWSSVLSQALLSRR